MEKRLRALLKLALKKGASDIHFTKRYEQIKIEMRIQNLMRRVKVEFNDAKLFNYLQYLANLDISNAAKPQTGQFEMEIDGRLLSLRYASISSLYFQNSVLRILNQELKIDAQNLSTVKDQNKTLAEIMQRTSGLVLFSGPTSSGKTTTIYSLLNNIKKRKIYTIEDPIEVYSDNFVQLEVNEALKFNIKEGVKQILRHDPDIIMIGEIRDENAAKMAIRAANTGHLVLSSVHAGSAKICINRLLDLGCDLKQLQDALILISNQKMYFKKDGERLILYEMMDAEELKYYFENKCNSDNYLSIEKQLKPYLNNNLINYESSQIN